MMIIKKILATLGALLLTSSLAFGQAAQPVTLILPGNLPVSNTNPLPVIGSFSATLSGFAPGGSFSHLTSAATSADVALPTGTVDVIFNTGTTAVSCNFTVGAGVAVANENVIQPGSWLGVTVGANTHFSCINQAGDATSNVVTASGGAGLPTGAGGGSSGSGSNASVGATGSTVPASATYIGIISGGNLTGWTGAVTQPTAANLNATVVGTGTFTAQINSFTSWGGSALGAMTNYGTSPGAVLVPGVNAFITNTNANGQATAANSSPVVLPAAQVTTDPCSLNSKINFTISTASGTLQIVAPSGSTQVYICSLVTVGATASIQNLVSGTGATCTTGTPVAIAGSTTAANGMSFAANGGFAFGNGGGTVLRTTTAGHGVCLIQSATAQISGGGTYVQQ